MDKVTLTDTSSILGLLDSHDPNHGRCLLAYSRLQFPLLTTWACMTESFYFLAKRIGSPGVDGLWRLINSEEITVYHPDAADLLRVQELMETYRDLPCDFADASLIAAAERLNLERIFTLDSHFYAYRHRDNGAFLVVP